MLEKMVLWLLCGFAMLASNELFTLTKKPWCRFGFFTFSIIFMIAWAILPAHMIATELLK